MGQNSWGDLNDPAAKIWATKSLSLIIIYESKSYKDKHRDKPVEYLTEIDFNSHSLEIII